MALVLKKATTKKQDNSEVYFEFRDATGDYDALTNDGGFGVPNPERNTLAIVLYSLNEKSDGAVEVIPEVHDPLTVTSFTLKTAGYDGVWHNWIFAIPIFDDQAVYTNGDIVYDNEDPANPFIKKYDGAAFSVVTAASLVDETSLVSLEFYEFFIFETRDFVQDLRWEQLEALRKVRLNLCEPAEWNEKHIQFVHARDTTESGVNNFCAGIYTQAQLDIEEVLNEKAELA